MANFISEDDIERATIKILAEKYGYRLLDCMTANPEDLNDGSNRKSKSDILFLDLLLTKAKELNPLVPEKIINEAIKEFSKKRKLLTPVNANRDTYSLLKDGIPVEFEDDKGVTQNKRVYLLDFDDKDGEKNDYLAVTQLWIKGKIFRRPDIILYINGIPLVFIELKNSNVNVRHGYEDNLTNYREDIPQLFLYNAVCILSNALESKVGSFTAEWEHFFRWLRIDDEREQVDKEELKKDGSSLVQIIDGLLPPHRILDYIENYVLYYNEDTKIIAQNHQFLGVNKTIESFKKRKENEGKIGVFWHTQASGKSFSMIFFYRKVFRKFKGNFSFVIITDRDDLDTQIYKNFIRTATVSEKDAAQPKSGKQLREYLQLDKKAVFTLIQKFQFEKGKKEYPRLYDPTKTEREVVVIVDEAHRTQYKDLADNMRKALTGANFLAFTGTPLLGKRNKKGDVAEGKTNSWFGGYVSEYNFKQAMDDEATVPLYYQKSVPEVLIQNDELSDELAEILEEDNLSDIQAEKIENEYAKEVQVIKRDDRLDIIAKDIVRHLPDRGYLGKALVISVDKFTSVKMYDKVQKYWKEEIKNVTGLKSKEKDLIKKEKYKRKLEYMKSLDMAVVISEEKGEKEKFAKQGLNIEEHRKRLKSTNEHGHDLEYQFKDPEDKLQVAFVCSMWLTGFDAPTISTLYMDKPMKSHTLMQTISRANRVSTHKAFGISKVNGEILDYYNVFKNMEKALGDYAVGDKGEKPVQFKDQLFELLDKAIEITEEFCLSHDVNLNMALEDKEDIFKNIDLFDDWSDKLMTSDKTRKEFNVHQNTVKQLYQACKPEIIERASERPLLPVINYLRGVIDSSIEPDTIDETKRKIDDLLDQSVIAVDEDAVKKVTENLEKNKIRRGKILDLSKLDYGKIGEKFKTSKHKNIEINDIRLFIQKKLEKLLEQNNNRASFIERYQRIIDNYNSESSNKDELFDELMKFTQELDTEEERHIKEGLSEDELELYDILQKDKMTKEEKKKVKLASKELLAALKDNKPKLLIQDWYKDSQTQERIRSSIESILDKTLPDSYEKPLFNVKCNSIYDLALSYSSENKKWGIAA